MYLVFSIFFGCIVDKDNVNIQFDTEYKLERIQVYADSTLELFKTVYPTDDVTWVVDIGELSTDTQYFLKKNGRVIWSVNTERFETYQPDLNDLPDTMGNLDYSNVITLSDGKRLVLIYIDDCLYILDRSQFLGAGWFYVSDESNGGIALVDQQTYFCFKKINE